MRLKNDNSGNALLMNPVALIIILIVVVIFAIIGGLAVLYAPNIAAAAVLALIAVIVVWKVPIPDIRVKLGVFAVLIISAILIYFYGAEFLGVA